MPAPQRYPSPAEQLRKLAVVARREGIEFDEFWVQALRTTVNKKRGTLILEAPIARAGMENPPEGVILWPGDARDRKLAFDVLLETKEVWRIAYELGDLPPAVKALKRLDPRLFRDENELGDALVSPDDDFAVAA